MIADHTRRRFLGGLAACGCLAAAESGSAVAPRRGARRIDVHHHFGSPAYDAFAAAHAEAGLPPAPKDGIARSIEGMDQSGTQLAILSSFAPAVGGTPADRQKLARGINEFGASIAQRYPSRFATFAVLPLPDVDACLAELAYGLDTLGAVGASIYTEAAGKYLGDPQFAPLMVELNRRSAVLFVHPKTDVCCRALVPGVPDSLIEFGTSTTRTIASLLFTGAADRYPNIRFIFSHGGGTMPFLIERFLGKQTAEIVPGVITTGQQTFMPITPPKAGALAALRRFHYDTAQIANPVALRTLAQVVTPERIVFGTDVWFRGSVESATGIETSRVFSPKQQEAVARGNAVALMPVLARR